MLCKLPDAEDEDDEDEEDDNDDENNEEEEEDDGKDFTFSGVCLRCSMPRTLVSVGSLVDCLLGWLPGKDALQQRSWWLGAQFQQGLPNLAQMQFIQRPQLLLQEQHLTDIAKQLPMRQTRTRTRK